MTKTLKSTTNERITATKVSELETNVKNMYRSEDGRYWEVQRSKFCGMLFIPLPKEWAEKQLIK